MCCTEGRRGIKEEAVREEEQKKRGQREGKREEVLELDKGGNRMEK